MLGLSHDDSRISLSMITTAETLTGFEILSMMGTVEGVAEESFAAVQVGHVGFHKGGVWTASSRGQRINLHVLRRTEVRTP